MTTTDRATMPARVAIATDWLQRLRDDLTAGRIEWWGDDDEPPAEVAEWLAIWQDLIGDLAALAEVDEGDET